MAAGVAESRIHVEMVCFRCSRHQSKLGYCELVYLHYQLIIVQRIGDRMHGNMHVSERRSRLP